MTRKLIVRTLALLMLLAIAWATVASASAVGEDLSPDGDAFPIGPLAGEKSTAAVAMAADGRSVAAWTLHLASPVYPNTTDVYVQRVNPEGDPVGGPMQMNTATDKSEFIDDVAIGDDGQFVAVWSVYFEVRGRCFNAAGVPYGPEFELADTGRGGQDAAVAKAADGSFVAVWVEQYYDSGYDYEIMGRRFSADCEPLGPAFPVNDTDTGEESQPDVAVDGQGNFLVAWSGFDNHENGVFARRFAANGQPLGGQHRVNKPQRFAQYNPTVGLDAAGNAVITYASAVAKTSDGFDYDILVRRYDSNDNPVGGVFPPSSDTEGTQYLASVAMTASGRFAILWTVPEEDGGLLLRGFDPSGEPTGPPIIVNDSPQIEFLGGLTSDGESRFLTTWTRHESLYASQVEGQFYAFDAAPPAGDTLTPTNDAFINLRRLKSNYGSKPVLKVRDAAADFHTYIKFNAAGLAAPVQSATLRLYVTNGGPDGGNIYAVSSYFKGTTDYWLEEDLTPRNAPPITGAPLAGFGPVSPGWVEVDVTAAVNDGLTNEAGRVSFGIKNASSNLVAFSSKEGAHAPELVIVTTP